MNTQTAFEYIQSETDKLHNMSDEELIDWTNQMVRSPFYGFFFGQSKILLEAEIKRRNFNSETLFYWSEDDAGGIVKKFDLHHKVKLVNGFIVRTN